MEVKRHKKLILLFALFCLVSVYFFVFFVDSFVGNQNQDFWNVEILQKTESDRGEVKEEKVEVFHQEKPEVVRGIYLTAHSASRESFRKRIIGKYKAEAINSLVIDIKDYTGFVLYDSALEEVKAVEGSRGVFDIKEVVKEFHEAGFYLIARQTVFQDPVLSQKRTDLALKNSQGNVWKEYSGLSWLDPASKEVWDYNLKIAEEAVNFGFDEVNFDYVRYPSDGNLENLNYNLKNGEVRTDVLGRFYKYMYENLSQKVKVSFDFFGMTMDYPDGSYDLGIGQRNMDIIDSADFVSPMMYPSHYPDGYLGLANPASHPYTVIRSGLGKSEYLFADKEIKVRPWLQAFHIGDYYNQAKIKEQARAVEESVYTDGWLLWNAANKYPDYIFEIFD